MYWWRVTVSLIRLQNLSNHCNGTQQVMFHVRLMDSSCVHAVISFLMCIAH